MAAAGEGYALPTFRRRVAAIARACRIAGHPLDTKGSGHSRNLRGIGRKHGTPPRRSAALTIEDMRRLVRAYGTTLAGVRDRALFLVGFAGALRRSDLVCMNIADLTCTEDGRVLLITRLKTDVEGAGARIGISRGKAVETCAVTALYDSLTKAGIDDGPIFRKVNRGGAVERGRLTAVAFLHVLTQRAGQARITNTWAEPVSPHAPPATPQ